MTPDYRALGLDCAANRVEHRQSEFARSLRELESNCGRLNLTSEAVHLAVEIAALEPALDDPSRIALIVLIVMILASVEDGSTQFPVTGPQSIGPLKRYAEALLVDPLKSARVVAEITRLVESGAVSRVIGGSGEFRPLIYRKPWLVQQRIDAAETNLAAALAQLIAADRNPGRVDEVDAAIADVRARPSFRAHQQLELSDEQFEAVRLAASSHLSVISGGPGTGKTSIVVAIVRVLARLGVAPSEIALAAPTGKAAHRMREAVLDGLGSVREPAPTDAALLASDLDAATLHRLLGFSPESGRFRRHRNNPLQVSAVILDEASMIDVMTMERLLEALPPGARLVIMGDADQLPSITAGAVLRDLAGMPGRCIRLTHNYRAREEDPAGRAIRAVADAIRRGELLASSGPGAALVTRRETAAEVAFAGVELLAAREGNLAAFLTRWHRERLFGAPGISELLEHEYVEQRDGFAAEQLERLRLAFAWAAGARVLCATRLYGAGSERINQWMHAQTLTLSGARGRFVPGEPLIVLRNDYERGLFNGDQGLVLNVRRMGATRGRPAALFARGRDFAVFETETLADRIEYCYAMTVHKAQGSEFDSVAFIAPDHELAMFSREILYTALTRSGKSIVLAGGAGRLDAAIARTAERYSGLAERLARLAS
ncbi:MAG TPA: AAA family ATPase [Candidatus Binataceae bacterium]|nr:AAA family ATPase [Candidatus Binataceae bacterium]